MMDSLIAHSFRLKAVCQIINLYSDEDLPSQSRLIWLEVIRVLNFSISLTDFAYESRHLPSRSEELAGMSGVTGGAQAPADGSSSS